MCGWVGYATRDILLNEMSRGMFTLLAAVSLGMAGWTYVCAMLAEWVTRLSPADEASLRRVYATLVLLLLILPGWWGFCFAIDLRRRSAARRQFAARSANRCTCCGYSLEGNASGICPECGTPVAAELEIDA